MKNFKFLTLIWLVVYFLFIVSCKKESKNYISFEPKLMSNSEMKRLSDIIKNTGNPSVYGHFIYYLKTVGGPEKIYPLAKIMSDKYDSKEAMFHVYNYYPYYKGCLSFEDLEKSEKEYALRYLIKSSKKGSSKAKEILLEYASKNTYITKEAGEYKIKVNLELEK